MYMYNAKGFQWSNQKKHLPKFAFATGQVEGYFHIPGILEIPVVILQYVLTQKWSAKHVHVFLWAVTSQCVVIQPFVWLVIDLSLLGSWPRPLDSSVESHTLNVIYLRFCSQDCNILV